VDGRRRRSGGGWPRDMPSVLVQRGEYHVGLRLCAMSCCDLLLGL